MLAGLYFMGWHPKGVRYQGHICGVSLFNPALKTDWTGEGRGIPLIQTPLARVWHWWLVPSHGSPWLPLTRPLTCGGEGHHTCHRSSGMRECGFTYMGSSPAMVWTHLGLGRTAHNKVGSPSTLQCWSQLSIKILLSLFWLLWAFIFHDITWLWISLAPQTLCNITVLAIQTRISDGTNNLSWLTWTSFLGLVRFI